MDAIQDSGIEPEQLEEEVEEVEEAEETEIDVEEDAELTDAEVAEYLELDGEKYTPEDIKELKQGSLRQSDYTKKTQELAQQRRQLEEMGQQNAEAQAFYEYFMQNPQLIQQLQEMPVDPQVQNMARQMTPEMQMIRDMQRQMQDDKLNMEIDRLSNKYEDFDAVEVIERAIELGTEDLEFVYKGISKDKFDEDAIRAEVKKEIMEEIQKNKKATKTLVNTGDKKTPEAEVVLTAQEKRVADGLGLSEEEYAKWRT